MTYDKYEHQVTSVIPWIKELPLSWNIKRLKFATNLINDKVNAETSRLPYIGLEHIESWTGKKVKGEIVNSEGLASRYQYNDVLFGKLRPYLAKVYLSQEDGLVSSEALVIRGNNEVCPDFLKYYMLSSDFINIVDSSTYGSKMPRASWDFIGNLPLLIPSLAEQQTIAKFLDYKTAQIDVLIKKKQELLEKLAEKRTAMISHAVTKGLDPSVPMKDSGVEWLGQIPAHWQAKRLKFATSLINDKVNAETSNLPYIGLEHIESWTGKKIAGEIANSEGIASRYQINDVLFGKLRPYLAKVYLAQEDGLISSEALVIRGETEVCPDFLKYYMLSSDFINIVDSSTYGSKMPRASWDFIGNLPLLIPALSEQLAIASFLDIKLGEFSKQEQMILKVIEKLQEYRSALITNAVTGKIDVRDFKIPEKNGKNV